MTTSRHWPSGLSCLVLPAKWQQQGMLRPLDVALAQILLQCRAHQMETSEIEIDQDAAVLAALLSRYLADGHTCLALDTLSADLDYLRPVDISEDHEQMLPGQWWARYDPDTWGQRLRNSFLVTTQPEDLAAPLVLEGKRLYLYRLWVAESGIAASLHHRLDVSFDMDPTTIASLQAMFQQDDSDGEQDIDWQMLACAMAVSGALTLITGGPGTGKTTTVMRLLALLQQQALQNGKQGSHQPLRMALAAPTGKAAARLAESIAEQIQRLPGGSDTQLSIPTQVTTLHRLLGSRPDTRHFIHHKDNPLALDVLVVDEASMIDLELMHALLQALAPEARLILLGDKDQLASVEAGAVLGELCHQAQHGWYTPGTWSQFESFSGQPLPASHHIGLRMGQPDRHRLAQRTIMLRHSRRFSAASGIGQLAAAINAMDVDTAVALLTKSPDDIEQLAGLEPGSEELRQLVQNGYGHFLNLLQESPMCQGDNQSGTHADVRTSPHWQAWARELLTAFDEFRLLCAVREGPWGVQKLNARVEQWVGVSKGGGLSYGEQSWYAGRPVMLTRNDYALGLMNGDIGITVNVPDGKGGRRLRVAFPNSDQPGHIRFILPGRLTAVETVYAMTVHKSQGSEFVHTVLILPDVAAPVLTKELLYTGVTRARTQLTLVSPSQKVFQQAIRRKVRRYGGLRERMQAGL